MYCGDYPTLAVCLQSPSQTIHRYSWHWKVSSLFQPANGQSVLQSGLPTTCSFHPHQQVDPRGIALPFLS